MMKGNTTPSRLLFRLTELLSNASLKSVAESAEFAWPCHDRIFLSQSYSTPQGFMFMIKCNIFMLVIIIDRFDLK